MPTEKTRDSQARYHVPTKGIQVENTAHCNLRCHMCNREQLLRLRSGRQSLSLCDVEKIAHLLKEYGLKDLHYYNLGEPFLSPDIHEQIKIIRQHNPDIRIITLTNGQLLKGSDKTKAALSMDYIGISLDGVNQDTVSKYQVGGNFETAYQNMANLVLERKRHNLKGPIIEWIYVLFRWNDHPRYIAKAIELAKKADVDVIGFYRGDVKLVDRSLRWYYHPYFKTLGNRTRNSIIVNLHNIPSHLLFK
jgi:wyosine [tRNA(Phe)-imidazoG37] synthetase (radical SAM superfamily)